MIIIYFFFLLISESNHPNHFNVKTFGTKVVRILIFGAQFTLNLKVNRNKENVLVVTAQLDPPCMILFGLINQRKHTLPIAFKGKW